MHTIETSIAEIVACVRRIENGPNSLSLSRHSQNSLYSEIVLIVWVIRDVTLSEEYANTATYMIATTARIPMKSLMVIGIWGVNNPLRNYDSFQTHGDLLTTQWNQVRGV